MEYLLVGFGGIFGSITRYALGKVIAKNAKTRFPIRTFIINITGAFLLGFLTANNFGRYLYLVLGEGFLGSYTTFSTFMFEGFTLFSDNQKLNAISYIILSILIGVIGFVLGSMIKVV